MPERVLDISLAAVITRCFVLLDDCIDRDWHVFTLPPFEVLAFAEGSSLPSEGKLLIVWAVKTGAALLLCSVLRFVASDEAGSTESSCACPWLRPQPALKVVCLLIRQDIHIAAVRAQGSDFSPPSDGDPLSSLGWAEEDESEGEEDISGAQVRQRCAQALGFSVKFGVKSNCNDDFANLACR